MADLHVCVDLKESVYAEFINKTLFCSIQICNYNILWL
jgi:hypothetical protein